MRPLALPVLGLVAAGCAGRPADGPGTAADRARRESACAADEDAPGPRYAVDMSATPPADGERIAAVVVEGRRGLPEEVIREAIHERAGAPFDAGAVAKDVRALDSLAVFEDVRVDAEPGDGGLTLTYHVAERPFVERVFVEGAWPKDAGAWFFPVAGDVYDGLAVKRAAAGMVSRLVRTGRLDAVVVTHARRVAEPAVDLCVAITPGLVYHVRKVAFDGNRVLSAADLQAALDASLPDEDRGKINAVGGLYRADLIERARLFLAELAYDRGLLEWESGEPVVTLARASPDEGSVDITFPVTEGPVFHVSKVTFSGALAAPEASYDALLDVHPGEVFSRARMTAVIERVNDLHTRLGRKGLSVEPHTELDGEHVSVDLRVEGPP